MVGYNLISDLNQRETPMIEAPLFQVSPCDKMGKIVSIRQSLKDL